MTKHRARRWISACALVAICTLAIYHASYPVKMNPATLPKEIESYYSENHSGFESPEIKICCGVRIGRKDYYLIELGTELGTVTIQRGFTGRGKITHFGYGDGLFLDGIVEDAGQKWLIFGGRDITAQIEQITVDLAGQRYELNVGQKPHFLCYTAVPNDTEERHVDRGSVRFYDENGIDITARYDLSGGGIW